MNFGSSPGWDDTVLPFQLDRTATRGRVARLRGALQHILSQHGYPEVIESLLAEATLLTVLIGQAIRTSWKLSLQVRGNGPARLIATDYFGPAEDGSPAKIRAYAGFDETRLDPDGDAFTQAGSGCFSIMIDQGGGTAPYQGITPLAGGSLAACAENYFAQSEQLPTRFALAFGRTQIPEEEVHWRAGGVMLQQMPDSRPRTEDGGSGTRNLTAPPDILDRATAETWNRVNLLLDAADEIDLIGPSVAPADLLVRLFRADGPRAYRVQPVEFGCTCTKERARTSLSLCSTEDPATMTTDEGVVTVDCQFCGAHYEFEPIAPGIEARHG